VLRELREILISRRANGYHNLVLIDDADLIKDGEILDQLSLLTDLYDDRMGTLLSLILFARPGFLSVLEQYEGLLQRVENRWFLEHLSAEQTRDYITHRLSTAGGNGWIVGDDAVTKIHEYSSGVLRKINTVCDLALYLGMSENAVRVDAEIVGRIVKDMERTVSYNKEDSR
jgi:type II secretory pathway predicted ATPase ExeA